MKQNKKGFTLIELLAVIVILAIIALIATPIVLNMVNSARKSAAKSSTLGFVDSIEYYAGFHNAQAAGGIDITGYETALPVITAPDTTVTCTKAADGDWDATCKAFMDAVKGTAKGAAPEEATIVLNANGKVQNGTSMKYNGFTCTYTGQDVDKCE